MEHIVIDGRAVGVEVEVAGTGRPVVPSIDVPTLLLYGDDDRRAPVDPVDTELAARIRGAQLVVIEQSGHVCSAEQPEAFNAAVRDFAAVSA